ncbi:hypothetical protein [Stenotrophomonas sp. CFBP8980]|uniref:hypothetical protein n=1 Tax=Stenotrophomonas sp. CFBP8980 TaxID=3096523 RepID=UPI0005AF2541|nr:hypothetical protein [Stenotrophomonas sp. CFBP8980]KIP87126.1 hypothetical protein SN15_04175 [Stenotrophomonas maltophilia]MDY1033665.1 hypothetical protein [Stenotrophomonas sp. CFBP8980]
MSKLSKAKRDKRKKQQPKRAFARLSDQQQVQNHAVLTNEEGQVVAAIGLQGRQWLLSIGGQTMGNADDPMPMLAMLKHLANVQGKEGRKVDLQYSEGLGELIKVMAAEKELDADAYLDQLAAEFDNIDAEDAAEGEAAQDVADAEAATEAPADAEAETEADADDKPKA